MLRKQILIPALAVVIGGASFLGVSHVSAQNADGFPSDLVTAIAQKFNLPQDQVQQVFTEHKQKHHAEMEQKMQERLTQLVTDGKLTEAQKQAIITKMAEMKNSFNPETMKDLTPEQRKQQMDQHRKDLDAWAKSQGIDPTLFPMRMGGHPGGMHRWKMSPNANSSPAQ